MVSQFLPQRPPKMLLLPSLLSLAALTTASLTYKSVDWSSLLIEEAAGKHFSTSSNVQQPLETILKSAGVNAVRQRLWVNPSNGDYNLAYNLKLAKRAHAAGLQIYLDLHYSDTWADPGHQAKPAAWTKYGVDDLAWEVYNYTLATMNAFQAANVPLSIVSIGNEITAGMLFPTAQLSSSGGAYNLARILHSASSGIKDSSLSPKPKIAIHLDNGWDSSTQTYWYSTVLSQGPFLASDYDIQALSYYPFYNPSATLAALKSSIATLKAKYGKQVVVAETDWPTSCPSPKYAFPADAKGIPFSAAGQSTWLRDVAAAGGEGLFYWEPAWLDNAALGSSCAYNTMFDNNGKALSSLATFGEL